MPADPAFRADVLAGLAAPVPAVPARWLYDRRGSELFEEITRLPEYYPTRTETAMLERCSADFAAMFGPGAAVVEFGSGSSAKTPILLRAVDPAAYVPIDISGDFLRDSADALQAEFPDLAVHPVEADFMRPLELPAAIAGAPKLGFFPGSTIGNFVAAHRGRPAAGDEGDARRRLPAADRHGPDQGRRRCCSPPMTTPPGVTAAFNLNLLAPHQRASWTATSRSTPSATARSGTTR